MEPNFTVYECIYCLRTAEKTCNCEKMYSIIERYLSNSEVLDPDELTSILVKGLLWPPKQCYIQGCESKVEYFIFVEPMGYSCDAHAPGDYVVPL